MNIRTCLVAWIGLLAAASVSGAAIIAYQDGVTVPHNNWTITPVWGAPAGTLVVGEQYIDAEHTTARQVTDSTGVGPDVDIIYNTSGLTGNYLNFFGGNEQVRAITAEFYAYQTVGSLPSDFRLYMYATDGDAWYYDVGPLAAGWTTFNVNFIHLDDIGAPFPGWYSDTGGTMAEFYTDLGSVSRIGFELQYLIDTPNQTFGFDYIALYDTYFVPEPETYLMLAVALASLAFVFREQLRESIRTAMASVAG
jgi:hypothetical protein